MEKQAWINLPNFFKAEHEQIAGNISCFGIIGLSETITGNQEPFICSRNYFNDY
jgi:hypothetical protein